ncbi:MAG: tRNA (adenosine(37)-N6)-threonylcarbamoyltransferase complex ATPase subunit type 1 TsaE [Lapillicoccus sp.]
MPEPSPLTEPLRWVLPTAEATRDLGRSLGRVLAAGDVLLLTGDLGAGKTTLTQGLAEGLDVRGPVTSPTFVIARVHPSLVGGPPLVHVDAYRLGGGLEIDDLDLDAVVEDSITVVEWGHGVAELLTGDRLELVLEAVPPTADLAPGSDPSAGARHASLTATGPRWSSPAAQALLRAELRAGLRAELSTGLRAELSTGAGPGASGVGRLDG